MKFNFITIFPELIESALKNGVIGQSIKKQLLNVESLSPRQFASDLHKTIDDKPFGGSDGMLMLAETLQKSLDFLTLKSSVADSKKKVIYLSPQGRVFHHSQIASYLEFEEMTFVCGRYAGVDHRFLIKNNIEEVSMGDFVVSGGELPALIMMDAISRQVAGVLGNSNSPVKDSFFNNRLEAPQFSRPKIWNEMSVPEVLVSGNHARIKEWEDQLSWLVTLKKRPDLIKNQTLPLKSLKAFYEKMTDEEKIVCGIHDMLWE